ncbi:hypothetical protein AAFF_G00023340 [Aldrovandia affinis]|uniref:Uncharacterized protein n=1 Tax=Aldrovandia affinis TaxID=143900 RepID=A0AAD7T5N8_9TELE|nr:hypothetical protein AAFF_G00023340 [Aldrovandia affinis]
MQEEPLVSGFACQALQQASLTALGPRLPVNQLRHLHRICSRDTTPKTNGSPAQEAPHMAATVVLPERASEVISPSAQADLRAAALNRRLSPPRTCRRSPARKPRASLMLTGTGQELLAAHRHRGPRFDQPATGDVLSQSLWLRATKSSSNRCLRQHGRPSATLDRAGQ